MDSKPLWQRTIRSATRLAVRCEEFRGALKGDAKVEQWLADSRGATPGQSHVKELSPLLEVLARS